jgi:uncharacterized protein involved in exopolysaccharide biosynthesis/Mrp family chromosome partitioning ATPase
MLAYDQPIGPATVGAARPPYTAAGFSVFDLAGLLWRQKVAIVAAGLICACAAVAIGKTLTPKYSASAQLYVDPRELQLVDRELTPRAQDVSGLAMVVESQARLITSNEVMLQVIRNTKLDRDPEFGGVSKGMLASLLGLVGIDMPAPEPTKFEQAAALDALNRHVAVRKSERSFIVDIDVWSRDPAKAAMIANALADAYLAESRNSQATAARRATSDLSGRLKDLKDRLRTAENALAVYKAQNNFVGTQDTLISDQQLSAGNQRLAAARAATLDAQAKYDQIESSRRAAADSGAIPEALQSPTIANLRAQYAEARKRLAELSGELGPRHPALRQMQQQVDDLKRTIGEEVDRFVTSSKNDLTRARDYEASLNKALDAQKRQSVQLSQASVRLRELERDVEASRDVYQSFLKRSRETEEQESLNTSAARVVGEATIPQRRSFPPGMSTIALIGFMLGAAAAMAWSILIGRSQPGSRASDSVQPATQPMAAASPPASAALLSPPPSVALLAQEATALAPEKPPITLLSEADVIRTLSGILASGGVTDLTRMGWPTLRTTSVRTTFHNAMRDMRAVLAKRSPARVTPVMAVIGEGAAQDRSVATVNIALAAAREGAKVLLIDADHMAHALSDKISPAHRAEAGRPGWFGIGAKPAPAIETANGIWLLPAVTESDLKSRDTAQRAIAQARAAGGYDLIVLDGPALPWSAADHALLELANGLVAVLPANLDVNNSIENIITALGGSERSLVGVVLNEVGSAAALPPRDKQYA